MAKKTITANERLQLMGLLVLSTRHNAALKAIVGAAKELTGDELDGGHCEDGIYCDYDADEMLSRLGITVEPAVKLDAVPE